MVLRGTKGALDSSLFAFTRIMISPFGSWKHLNFKWFGWVQSIFRTSLSLSCLSCHVDVHVCEVVIQSTVSHTFVCRRAISISIGGTTTSRQIIAMLFVSLYRELPQLLTFCYRFKRVGLAATMLLFTYKTYRVGIPTTVFLTFKGRLNFHRR